MANPTDKCGKEIKPGQLVDMCLTGMFGGYVVEVRDPKVQVPGMRTAPPCVVVQIGIMIPINDGVCDTIYITAEPDQRNHDREIERRSKRNSGPTGLITPP